MQSSMAVETPISQLNSKLKHGAQGGNDIIIILVDGQRRQPHEGRDDQRIGRGENDVGKLGRKQIPHPFYDVQQLVLRYLSPGLVIGIQLGYAERNKQIDGYLRQKLNG